MCGGPRFDAGRTPLALRLVVPRRYVRRAGRQSHGGGGPPARGALGSKTPRGSRRSLHEQAAGWYRFTRSTGRTPFAAWRGVRWSPVAAPAHFISSRGVAPTKSGLHLPSCSSGIVIRPAAGCGRTPLAAPTALGGPRWWIAALYGDRARFIQYRSHTADDHFGLQPGAARGKPRSVALACPARF